MNEIIELKGVTKIYKMDKVLVPALRGINLKIRKGEFVSIMGPSGSGKTTLMNLIGCLDRPTEGEIYIANKNIAKLGDDELAKLRREKIGFVFQQFNLIPRLTALENVELPMWFAGLSKKKRRERAIELLKLVGLEKRIHHKPAELSGGERQRVSIARALANNPEIILADEPTGNLDTKTGKEIMEILKDLNKQGKTIVLVTHDETFAKEAERIIKIRDGRLLND
ncbi:MAG: macrolide ABC transporter ATP-binding protein [Candidatus Hydrothermarchaeota archaeon]|nr:MAG: macrolide ABC transporter ATP-binding protein [Candidatus Hydrothermarchaeota archaeon]